MIAEADIAGDGRVDYSEFAHLWKTFLLTKHQKPAAGRLQQVPSQEDRIYLILSYVILGACGCIACFRLVFCLGRSVAAHSSYSILVVISAAAV